jgi:hypothetical protein
VTAKVAFMVMPFGSKPVEAGPAERVRDVVDMVDVEQGCGRPDVLAHAIFPSVGRHPAS